MPRAILPLFAACSLLAAFEPPRFERDILPIFTANCFNCHNAGSLVGLDLRTAVSTLRGSHQGPVVVKGAPEKSPLYLRVSNRSMPPPAFKLKLTDAQIETIKAWIQAGALFDDTGQADLMRETARFDQTVRPLLERRCTVCHGLGSPMAGLDLRTLPSLLRGSRSGPVVVEGRGDKSVLLRRVASGSMPPRGAGTPLNEAEVTLLRQWVDTARFGESVAPPALRDSFSEAEAPAVTRHDREFWAFQSPVAPPIPAGQAANPIDAFVLVRLKAKGLGFSPAASKLELARRAFLDLIGLPPTPEELKAFLADTRPDAYERLVDRLLASPQYGVRWARHWLDSAGYTDTTGQETIFEGIWRYRDYVVDSFNADKPYDVFLTEQIAGDELVDWRSAAKYTPEIITCLTATGYLRSTFDRTDADITNFPQERYDVLVDLVDKVSNGLIGLSVGCARCHSHKYDPISQRDYYRLMTVFSSSYNPWNWVPPQQRFLPSVSRADQEIIDRHNAELDGPLKELQGQLARLRAPYEERLLDAKLQALPEAIRPETKAAVRTPAEKQDIIQQFLVKKFGKALAVEPDEIAPALSPGDKEATARLEREISRLNGLRLSYDKIQALWDTGPPPTMRLLQRGVLASPGPKVQPGFLTLLSAPGQSDCVRPADARGRTSGQRLAFARWLTNPEHPLTARVLVNRVWQHHFGVGIVATPDNFGRMGTFPTHPELLDWLAVDLMRHGWSIKRLHRMIMTSTTYRQSTSRTAHGDDVDPENRLLWRMNLQRLESEALRDSMLAAGGNLDCTMGGPPVLLKPRTDGLQEIADKDAGGHSQDKRRFRRSLYLEARRGYPLTFLEVFDSPLMQTSCNRRMNSATPLQSLTLLNDEFVVTQSRRMAERVAAAPARQRVELAYVIAFSRKPGREETETCSRHLEEQTQAFLRANMPPDKAELMALASLCQVLLSSNEFLYRD
jgi:mono/diheme cytochrome c family protein